MAELLTVENGIALLTLTALEIVLGIDNIVFISILTGKLPEEQRPRARMIGLTVAMGTRILLLLTISWLMGLTRPLFTVPEWLAPSHETELAGEKLVSRAHAITGKDLILLVGGLFLLLKATKEIHHKVDGGESAAGEHPDPVRRLGKTSFAATIVQIVLIDIVFSLDSVITAVGMAKSIAVMIAAVVIAVGVMMLLAGKISTFVEAHPTVKMLALAFLVLIGVTLMAESVGWHIPKGYIYFAMAFSLGVEMLNLRMAKRAKRRAAKGAP